MRVPLFCFVVALLTPCGSSANPDGPVGSIMLQPSFRTGPSVYQLAVGPSAFSPISLFEKKNCWRVALETSVPVWNYATLGFEFARSRAPMEKTLIHRDPSTGEITTVNVALSQFNDVRFFARIYIPFSSRAREELGR